MEMTLFSCLLIYNLMHIDGCSMIIQYIDITYNHQIGISGIYQIVYYTNVRNLLSFS